MAQIISLTEFMQYAFGFEVPKWQSEVIEALTPAPRTTSDIWDDLRHLPMVGSNDTREKLIKELQES